MVIGIHYISATVLHLNQCFPTWGHVKLLGRRANSHNEVKLYLLNYFYFTM